MPAGGLLITLVALLCCSSALASSVTVNLRIEGATKTLYEGPINAEPEVIETTSSKEPHPCNYAENGHYENEKHEVSTNGGAPVGTPTTALHAASRAADLAFNAEWSTSYGDFLITQVGSDIEQTESPYDSWGYAVNYTTAPVGGCQIALAPGNEVLWAYNYFNLKYLLSLSGPSSAEAGVPFTVHVTNGQNGEPVEGATIGEDVEGVTTPLPGSPTTNASGNATIALAQTKSIRLKATQPESVRSNGLLVSVGPVPCGCVGIAPATPPPVVSAPADRAMIESAKNDHVYSRRSAPRLLAGVVDVPVGGTLREVRISLKRKYLGRCYDFSGTREQFVRTPCARSAQFFSVGSSESFSYLLPSRLAPGQYVYEIQAVNDAGQATAITTGVSRVTFKVK
jgi:hypothetical protein